MNGTGGGIAGTDAIETTTEVYRGRRWAVWLLVTAMLLTIGAARAGGRREVASLKAGQSVFWQGDAIESTQEDRLLPVALPSPLSEEQKQTGCGEDCFEYALDIGGNGERLRVAVDTPDCNTSVTITLIDPTGERRDSETSCYSSEIYARDPQKGTWIVRAEASGGNPVFRLRAKLEGAEKSVGSRKALLPNLRVEPPHDFSLDSGGIGLASESCYEEEVVEDGAQRCLRFAVGPQNTGDGPLELKFTRSTEVSTDAAMEQRVYYSDGSAEMRPAGDSEFHKAHGHFHLKGFARFKLFRVTDRKTGEMVDAGTGNKAGFCLVDLRIAQWRSFDQQRSYAARSNCMPVGGKAELGLSAGWTDVYGPELVGNYIDIGDSPDGLYVLRVVVDSNGYILETNENDNVGYSYIEIKGDSIRLIERGRGSDPWDPNKKPFTPWWVS